MRHVFSNRYAKARPIRHRNDMQRKHSCMLILDVKRVGPHALPLGRTLYERSPHTATVALVVVHICSADSQRTHCRTGGVFFRYSIGAGGR
jgi:hypothetical protein